VSRANSIVVLCLFLASGTRPHYPHIRIIRNSSVPSAPSEHRRRRQVTATWEFKVFIVNDQRSLSSASATIATILFSASASAAMISFFCVGIGCNDLFLQPVFRLQRSLRCVAIGCNFLCVGIGCNDLLPLSRHRLQRMIHTCVSSLNSTTTTISIIIVVIIIIMIMIIIIIATDHSDLTPGAVQSMFLRACF
jgi:hypothetical protein